MFPVALHLDHVSVLLVGNGFLAERRLRFLDDDGAKSVQIFSENPSNDLQRSAGDRLISRLPSQEEVQAAQVILIADIDRPKAERIAKQAREAGKLVNVEDVNDLCDFYFTANVRRGDLVIAVSTSGASPTLARKMKDAIAHRFGPEWADYTDQLAQLRQAFRDRGASMKEIVAATEDKLKTNGWLKEIYPDDKEDVA